MAVEIFAGLKLITDLMYAVSGQLDSFKGTPKRQLANSLISLHEILKKVDNNVNQAFQYLDALNESQNDVAHGEWEMKIHVVSRNFGLVAGEFTTWAKKHQNFSKLLDLIHPEASVPLNRLVLEDYRVKHSLFEDFKGRVQKYNSDPFNRTNSKRIRRQLNKIKKLSNDLMREIRKIALANLRMEDIF